jgi:aminoglycoside phosphotransferase (APT) family kinase protein
MQRAQRFATGDVAKRRAIDAIARQYDTVVARLTALPRTIIHGEFYASNVIVRRRPRGQVCPVDWEMTALGPGLVDLAALVAGWNAVTRRALARAYYAETVGARPGGAGPLPREFSIDLDCCRLYLAVRMLGWSDTWEPPRDHAFNWLREASSLAGRLGH